MIVGAITVMVAAGLWGYGCTIYVYNAAEVSRGYDRACIEKIRGDAPDNDPNPLCLTRGGIHLPLGVVDVVFFLNDGPPGNFRLDCVRNGQVSSQDFDYYTVGYSSAGRLPLTCSE